MLTSSLRGTGLAGVPAEYLNWRYLRDLPQPLGLKTLLGYYARVQARRTTANGAFGLKLHFNQFQKLFMDHNKVTEAGVKFLKLHSHFVLTSRRDKIAQALSKLAASRSEIWNSKNPVDAGKQNHTFSRSDVPEILYHLRQTMMEELNWKSICEQLQLRCIEVVYEDLVGSPHSELGRVYSFLGIDAEYTPPTTVKLSRDSHRDAKQQFLEALGALSS